MSYIDQPAKADRSLALESGQIMNSLHAVKMGLRRRRDDGIVVVSDEESHGPCSDADDGGRLLQQDAGNRQADGACLRPAPRRRVADAPPPAGRPAAGPRAERPR